MKINRFLTTFSVIICSVFFFSLSNTNAQEKNIEYYAYIPLTEKPPTMPPISVSYYVGNMNPNEWFDLGCELGTKFRYLYQNRLIFTTLQFGKPSVNNEIYGAKIYDENLTFYSFNQIIDIIEIFSSGYEICVSPLSSAPFLVLGVGLNNLGEHVTEQHGLEWGNAIADVNQSLQSRLLGYRTVIVGAGDIELGFNSAQNTLDWVNGFLNNPLNNLYYYGAIEGCTIEPVSGTYDGDCSTLSEYAPSGGCNCFEWRQSDVWSVIVNNGRVTVIPQIYNNNGDNADQWYHMALYGHRIGHVRRVLLLGAFTQYEACQQVDDEDCEYLDNTPREGWQQLLNAFAQDSRTAFIPSTGSDIQWQNP